MNKKNVIVDVKSWMRLVVVMPVLLAIGVWYLVRADVVWKALRRQKPTQAEPITAENNGDINVIGHANEEVKDASAVSASAKPS